MLDNLNKYHIVLASNSPRRKELLSGLGVDYEVRTIPNIDESYSRDLAFDKIPTFLSEKKASYYLATMAPNELLITADTLVCSEGKVLGKPQDRAEAIEIIQSLSGKTHQVLTGVTLSTTTHQESFLAISEVTFDVLTAEEIEYYVDCYQPMDKAGAYGIQEWIGYIGVKSISGSFYNIMGLPVQQLYQKLKLF